eukprot:GHVP01020811.1.p1 GENE.GHVP01020811.1~~GHVP01020811.1.p1  ORF type:complete len:319 (+),score=53.88 GHVP01020811.1:28-957(+)
MPRRNRNVPPQAVNIPLDGLPMEDEDEEIPIPNDELLGTFVPPVAIPETFGAEQPDLEIIDIENQTAEEATPAPTQSFIGRIWGRLTNSPPYSTLHANNIELSPPASQPQEQGPRRTAESANPDEDEQPEPPSPADSSEPRSTLGFIRIRIYRLFAPRGSDSSSTTIPADSNISDRLRNLGTDFIEWGKSFGLKVDDIWTRMAGATPRTGVPADDDLPDDPSCIQLLLVVGLMFPPLPFILGSLLFCTTPTNQRSLRKWGLLHVLATFVSIPFFIMSIILAPEATYGAPNVFDRTINNEMLAPHVPAPV